jgi:opacity protein-like surface antigen
LKKSIALVTLTVLVLFAASAFGQTDIQSATLSTNLAAAAMPASPALGPRPKPASDSVRSSAQHWELNFHIGGTVGHAFTNSVGCKDIVAGSCDPNTQLGDADSGSGGISPVPTAFLTAIPDFAQRGRITPGNGALVGFGIGYDITEHVQLELEYNYLSTDVRLPNTKPLQDAALAYCSNQGDNGSGENCFAGQKQVHFLNDGSPSGNQHQLLFNLNYSFLGNKRFVPYVGAGLGMEIWDNNPKVDMLIERDDSQSCVARGGLACRFIFRREAGRSNSFATDFAFGFKYFFTEHFGFRAEARDVISWARMGGKAVFIDVDNDCDPINGDTACNIGGTPAPPAVGVFGLQAPSTKLNQDGTWNQFSGTAGVVWRF